jgi:signal transduction histidine kinase
MADVASSVLHNVGNVLNTVNVSCSVISEKVRKSRIESVSELAGLLKDNAGNLAGFFTEDATGKKLPDFIGKLAVRLSQERLAVLGELTLLRENIEHIKDIVAMQESRASKVDFHEVVSVQDVMDDALRIHSAAIAREGIRIVREYVRVPDVSLDRHKLLEILENLLTNATAAVATYAPAEKEIVIRIERKDVRALVSVKDNGIGIPPDNMTRIFAHGFSTTKSGHGLGLHSGVLAAREMGGHLTVYSKGQGHGATFTLELPLSRSSIPQEEAMLCTG